MTVLTAREAYRLWAPTYAAETAVSVLDQDVTAKLSPPTGGRRVLDAGCGTGRRLPQDARLAVGVDVSLEMLAMGHTGMLACADIRALPFAGGSFDLVWCRLVLGHLADLTGAYRELARVMGDSLLVTDFHPDAAAAGGRRSFRDARGRVHAVEHHVHGLGGHVRAARDAGLVLADAADGVIGPCVRVFYDRSGRGDAYMRDCGMAAVAGYLFRRPA